MTGVGATVKVGFRSDVGRVREENEDSYFVRLQYAGEPKTIWPDAVLAVADGMGGHEGGRAASQFVVRAIEEGIGEAGALADLDASTVLKRLEPFIESLNEGLLRLGTEMGAEQGIGSTLTIGILHQPILYLGHVGDSRCYRWRGGQLRQLTLDQSWVAEQERQGLLTAEEAESHPHRNVLTECLGLDPGVSPIVFQESVAAGDRYLFCSDGLYGPVGDGVIFTVLRDEPDPQACASRLVDLANQGGGPDNITVLVLDLVPSGLETIPAPVPIGAGRSSDDPSKEDTLEIPELAGAGFDSLDGPSAADSFETTKRTASPRAQRKVPVLVMVLGFFFVAASAIGGWYLYDASERSRFEAELRRIRILIEDGKLEEARSALAPLAVERPDEPRLAEMTRFLRPAEQPPGGDGRTAADGAEREDGTSDGAGSDSAGSERAGSEDDTSGGGARGGETESAAMPSQDGATAREPADSTQNGRRAEPD